MNGGWGSGEKIRTTKTLVLSPGSESTRLSADSLVYTATNRSRGVDVYPSKRPQRENSRSVRVPRPSTEAGPGEPYPPRVLLRFFTFLGVELQGSLFRGPRAPKPCLLVVFGGGVCGPTPPGSRDASTPRGPLGGGRG